MKDKEKKDLIKQKGQEYMAHAKQAMSKAHINQDPEEHVVNIMYDETLGEQQKIEKARRYAEGLDVLAKKKETLWKAKGQIVNGMGRDEGDEIDNMLVNSIKAKLQIIQN